MLLLQTALVNQLHVRIQPGMDIRRDFVAGHADCFTGAEEAAAGCAVAGYIEGLAANEISAQKADRLSDLMAQLEGL
ncbi:hypothetical protein RGV33_23155 [Pseudomonas sp. Bout1]|nr:hypothetical protein [Pseudomonas sp. Bout1]MDY7534541.1 hypothetical protein [Pseudomonas sp. Bout1]MEB0188378.1 hypothetical protein [Pseudomonas sp. Bout1]